MADEFVAELVSVEELTKDTKIFVFEKPADFMFQAGQFIFVTLFEGLDTELTHHFTIASAPAEEKLAFATRMTGSEYKNTLDALRPGQACRFRGPFGNFVLDGGAPAVFLAGGIGITPARSILKNLVETGSGRKATLVYANRDAGQIPFGEEIDDWARHHVGLKVIHVISRPSPDWKGRRGHIDSSLIKAEVEDLDRAVFYVSGPPAMIEAMDKVLAELGVPSERIKRESFVGY